MQPSRTHQRVTCNHLARTSVEHATISHAPACNMQPSRTHQCGTCACPACHLRALTRRRLLSLLLAQQRATVPMTRATWQFSTHDIWSGGMGWYDGSGLCCAHGPFARTAALVCKEVYGLAQIRCAVFARSLSTRGSHEVGYDRARCIGMLKQEADTGS